jgi:Arc/MetJ family transcription regulator
VAKYLIDLDEETLEAAQQELGTTTITGTVNEALRRVTLGRRRRVAAALDVLAAAHLDGRSEAWTRGSTSTPAA